MKVSTLIELLKTMPEDAEIAIEPATLMVVSGNDTNMLVSMILSGHGKAVEAKESHMVMDKPGWM